MLPGEACKTAEFNALFRAIEAYRRPRHRRLFSDMLAPAFLGPRAREGAGHAEGIRLDVEVRPVPR
nr:hypothetical protein [Candidatus Sigynarchaeum springense]